MLKQYRLGGGNINVSAFDQESASRFLGITDISLATTLLQHQLYIALIIIVRSRSHVTNVYAISARANDGAEIIRSGGRRSPAPYECSVLGPKSTLSHAIKNGFNSSLNFILVYDT